jgi:rare lipoprotein A (peptidoglycan hydrolase)
MRKGSTSLGGLGAAPATIGAAKLILPLLAVAAGAFLIEAPCRASEKAAGAGKPSRAPVSEQEEKAQREALERRHAFLERAGFLPRRTPAEKQKVVRSFNTRATWYGPGFHGRRTASGERFNQNAMTLASRHLPFGTMVRVTNPKNGKTVIGRVNDRGPFVRGYGVDLSRAMARQLRLNSGPVKVEILRRGKK